MAQFTLKHIEAFVQVADLGTFRRAAERLNTTQPNISNRIAQLEHHLGERVMERDAGSVRLTRKGEALLGPARQILAAMDAFLATTETASAFEGVLRLGVSEVVAHTWLRAFLTRMKDRFPALDVELTVDLSANLSRALFERDLDLTLQSGPFEHPARQTVALGQSLYKWVAAPELGLGDDPPEAKVIAKHPILTHARGTDPYRQLEEHFRAIGQTVRLVPASNLAVGMQMAVDGLGIACLPEAMLGDAVAAGRLGPVRYDWQPEPLRFAARWMIDPTPTYLSGAVEIARGLYPPEDK